MRGAGVNRSWIRGCEFCGRGGPTCLTQAINSPALQLWLRAMDRPPGHIRGIVRTPRGDLASVPPEELAAELWRRERGRLARPGPAPTFADPAFALLWMDL